jgi:hypothetical protein
LSSDSPWRRLMQINFEPVRVLDSPITVLHHLYYYTVQYGLSVRQFTGRNQEYWRVLPSQLRKALGNAKHLEQITRGLEEIAAGDKDRLETRRKRKDGWKGKEIILSAQLSSVLSALPRTVTRRDLSATNTRPANAKTIEGGDASNR